MPKRGPTGTVTFLSSDIERSTQLVRELGSAAFTDAMEKHSPGRAMDIDSAIGRSAGDPTAIVARIRASEGG